jgi:hypothetical protein
MFDIFGEFDNAEEINQAATGLLTEGDHKNILMLAKENGLDDVFAQAFINGEIPILTDITMAAVGKLELERNIIKDPFFNDMKEDMINYLLTSCSDEIMARAIRSKGKSLKGCFEYCKKEIVKVLGRKNGALRDRVVYAMEKSYYLQKGVIANEEKTIREDTDGSEEDTEE